MALTVSQYEDILGLLRSVGSLVDKLEGRNSAFSDDVLDWLKQAEGALNNNRLPDASRIASSRSRLIEARRGVQHGPLTFIGRPSARRIRDATAALVLQTTTDILHDAIADRKVTFAEAERISRQLAAIAKMKGLLNGATDLVEPHHVFLQRLQARLSADPDLANIHAHIVGLVGTTDALIFLDRALVSVV